MRSAGRPLVVGANAVRPGAPPSTSNSQQDLGLLRDELRRHATQLLPVLLGPPSSTSVRELRWGKHGSLAYSIEHGVYFDHEEGEGGDLIDLIMRTRSADFVSALDWIREHLGRQYRKPACRA